MRTFFFFLLLRNMKLWKEAIEARRNREIVITIAEMVLFVFSFGCFPAFISPLQAFTPTQSATSSSTASSTPCFHVSTFPHRYYAFVTVTTVGYGDITPKTQAGRFATTYYIVSILFWLPSKVGVSRGLAA